MKEVLIEEKFIIEYINDLLSSFKYSSRNNVSDRYHHNTPYKDSTSVIKHGILTMKELARLGIRNYSEEFLNTMSDIESHINGDDGVSLSVVGLHDLYLDEEVYDPYDPTYVDIMVSNNVNAGRRSIHYGNEFICLHSIKPNDFRAIDVRILDYIKTLKSGIIHENYTTQQLIYNFNKLREIAMLIESQKLDLDFREMGDSDTKVLDITKVKETPILTLKK